AILKEDKTNAAALEQKRLANDVIKTYGQGSQIQLAVRAVTGVLQGIATGEATQAAVGGLSPYANYAIKKATTDKAGNVNTEVNLMAHALLGAVEAYATGNNATAGAAGAVGGEVAAKIITEKLYNNSPEDLTEAQKQTVTALSQLASGLAGGLISDSTSGAINAAEIGKRAVENNSLLVDQFRAAKKADAESWKQNVRDIFGEGATSQLINGTINVIEETSDGALFLIDGGFDTLATITTCAVKDSYCNQAKQDLSKKNQAISDAVNSLMNGSYWNAIQTTAIQAYQGDQKALEDVSGLIIGILTPTVKGISNKETLDNFAYRVPEPLDSTKNLPVVGESLGYEKTTTYFRVEGGGTGNKTSQNRISINKDGTISINSGCSGQICISTKSPNHALYFLSERRKNGSVIVFEIDNTLHEQIMSSAVPQKPIPGIPRDINAPKIVDENKGQPSINLELPKVWDRLLEKHSSKARILTEEQFKNEYGQ
ncbi:VENN motif pre-toxin domain-containing protein, partial [Gallibacterium anatis]|uniref:VENN motif pre-toxin domain-containing protein n=1 Tax=Gallibacterium anatis TaxID=750 RepID=UPI0030C9AB69